MFSFQVNAAATNVERIGNTYSVSGNNVTTQYTPEGGSATNSIGAITITSGVGSIPPYQLYTGNSRRKFQLHSKFYSRRCLVTSAPATGAVSAFSNQTSTAAGTASGIGWYY